MEQNKRHFYVEELKHKDKHIRDLEKEKDRLIMRIDKLTFQNERLKELSNTQKREITTLRMKCRRKK